VITTGQVMFSAAMSNSSTMGNTSSGHRSADVLQDYGSLPTLLGSKAHISNGFDGGSALKKQAGSAQKKQEAKLAEQDGKIKGFVYGAHVEYYSKSYGEWIPAIIGDVRPNGCLKLLHDDGSVLKKEADPNSCVRFFGPNSVRLATEQAKQSKDKQGKCNNSLSDRPLARCSQAASGIEEAIAKWSSSEPLGSNEAYDQQMKHLHSLSEKFSAQLNIHRGLSEGMAQDQQLELSHLEFRQSLSKAAGPDMINSMHSSDELMQQMNFRHGLSSMYGQQLKLDRSLSAGMGSQAM